MTSQGLQSLWAYTLRQEDPTVESLERLADAVLEAYETGDLPFREHIKNRFKQDPLSTIKAFDPERFTLAMAREFIANELGYSSWDALTNSFQAGHDDGYPFLFKYAIAALRRGDFTALEIAVGGPNAFGDQIRSWLTAGYFAKEPETMAETFTAACMLGHEQAVAALLDAGVDPYAGMRTGLAGFHYAASSGRLNVVNLLIDRKVPMEVKNMYGGTAFEQAIWSAVNEYTPFHAEIVERLVEAGAIVDEGYDEWWDKQSVTDKTTKARIAAVLRRYAEFHGRVSDFEQQVANAEKAGDKRTLAHALKQLGNILRRPTFSRDAASYAYSRSAALYRELGMPLEEAWVKRHIGINHEYADRLEDAERCYDESLAIFREHALDDDPNYANTVRYAAVIKERLGKNDEAARLWEEAHDRYARILPDGLSEGEAEAAGWLTILAIERGDLQLASEWFSKAEKASSRSEGAGTRAFIEKVKERLDAQGITDASG
jgi:tetratricopeptide (TPR) repeat protein